MDRRRFLTGAAAAGAAGLAGCGVLGGPRELRPAETIDQDREQHLRYRTDGQRLATCSLDLGHYNPTGFDLDLHVAHREGTRVTGVTCHVRAPAGKPGVGAGLYLEAPQAEWPPVTFHQTRDGSAEVVSVEDLGELGDGTVTLGFDVRPVEEYRPYPVAVDWAVALSETGLFGAGYRLTGRSRVDLPVSGQ